ncbi:hypothetical protein H6P81_019565 [Aristolochia fimbriata]|uniref:Uncharacterized protein n=1 Tax=Aristolochia fimbriata TaxID=158543 RepID=A0AAV7DS02_ARIFI|nr:hypothetical protein H6P81_019565 [Aristolochia fimbriata]
MHRLSVGDFELEAKAAAYGNEEIPAAEDSAGTSHDPLMTALDMGSRCNLSYGSLDIIHVWQNFPTSSLDEIRELLVWDRRCCVSEKRRSRGFEDCGRGLDLGLLLRTLQLNSLTMKRISQAEFCRKSSGAK